MKTALLLQKLEDRLADLRRRCAPIAQHATLSARFDRQLFRTRSTRLQACLAEAEEHLAALRLAVERQQLPQAAWLAGQLASQLEAIAREADSWQLRVWDSAAPGLARWQRRRLQHQEYERRLTAMLEERQVRLDQEPDADRRQALRNEVVAWEGRLTRCRRALAKIEGVLARLTR
ncbi:primosomal replication protein N'' [Intestinirhabdus alba]|uniref:Primosomal replication protein N n=1 Tax=Intestinirhabdus alba TaxID=2899544 RepID=A0A6L6II51_9ENTR|nr:primosomal replication protein N'' [Intestinirhabdus alba]